MLRLITAIIVGILAYGGAFASDGSKVDLLGSRTVSTVTLGKVRASRIIVLDKVMRHGNLKAISDHIKTLAEESRKPIYLDIDSPGGSVRAGLNLIQTIRGAKEHRGVKTYCIVRGAAYSMAAALTAFCHRTYMMPGSDMMFHGASYGVRGNAEDIKTYVDYITRWLREMETRLAVQLGLTYDLFKMERGRELWMTAREAVRRGYADAMIEDFYHNTKPIDTGNKFGIIFRYRHLYDACWITGEETCQ